MQNKINKDDIEDIISGYAYTEVTQGYKIPKIDSINTDMT